MQYAILIYDKPGAYEALSPDEFGRVMAEYGPITEDPVVREGAQLQPVHTATTVRVSDGETLMTDGPFAATKEVLGGYYVIEVDDLDQALAYAARIPSARMGGAVEVRPIVEGAVVLRSGI